MPAFQNVGLELSFNQKKNNITPSHKEMEIERKNHNWNLNCWILGLISDDMMIMTIFLLFSFERSKILAKLFQIVDPLSPTDHSCEENHFINCLFIIAKS